MQVKTIAFYHYTFPAGGAEVVTCNLGRFFAKHGFRVLLYTWKPNEELLTEELRKIFDIRPLPDTKRISGVRNTDFLCESLKTERADVLFIQATTDIAFEQIRTRTTAKIIFCLHNTPFWEVYDLKHKKSSEIPRPTLTRRLEYALLRKPAYRLTRKLEQRYAQLYIRVLSNVDRFVTLCPGYSDEFEREIRRSGLPGCDFPRERLTAMLNPMLPTQEPAKTPKEKIVLYAGRFQRCHKRIDRLLKIWKRIEQQNPEWRLVIVGDGEERGDLEKQARRLKLQRIEFAGYQYDVTPFYRRATFVCLTSNFEGLPMCLMEGQQYGAIPVSFDSYSTCDGECGIMVPAYSLRKYAELLNRALADEELQKRMRENCYKAAERYDLECIGQEWLALFGKL